MTAIQYAVRFFIIKPVYFSKGISIQMPEWIFALFVLASLLILMGSFFIYDYYSIKQKQPILQQSKKQLNTLYSSYVAFTFTGCTLGLFVGWKIQFFNLGVLFIIYATLLYFYALRYKLLTFWGDFIIGFLAGWLLLHVWLFEFFVLLQNPIDLALVVKSGIFQNITLSISFYALFYTLVFFIQQILKDIIGKEQAPSGSNIFPIRLGIDKTKNILRYVLLFLFLVCILLSAYFIKNKDPYFAFWGLLMILFTGLFYFKLKEANTLSDFQKLHFYTDLLSIIGILSILIS